MLIAALAWADYAVIAAFFAAMVAIGAWYARRQTAASFTGAMGWLVYLLPDNWGNVARFLTATVVVAVLSEIFARILKTPATIFLIIGIIPMVPGGGIYYTLEALINGDMPLFVQRGMETAASAGAIAVGCSLVSSVARIIALVRRERENRQNRNTI